jgi:hypothetical protein
LRVPPLTPSQVVTGLATLQDAIQTLSSAYIKHTNAYLGEHGAGLEVETALSRLGDNPLLGGLGGFRGTTPAQVAPVDAKKEKKKRVHDPNAPKRPLTPYFLYMQTARPIIAEDLGPEVAKGAVSNEGVRRWKDMADEDKQVSIHIPNPKSPVTDFLPSSGQTSTRTTSSCTTRARTPTSPACSTPRT